MSFFFLQKVRLHFIRFDVEESKDCFYDSVDIYDGDNSNDAEVVLLCPTTSYPVETLSLWSLNPMTRGTMLVSEFSTPLPTVRQMCLCFNLCVSCLPFA